MKVMLLNVRSLANNLKLHFILQTIEDNNIDITCVTESWLNEGHDHTLAILNMFGYDLSHTIRSNKRGGAVVLVSCGKKD